MSVPISKKKKNSKSLDKVDFHQVESALKALSENCKRSNVDASKSKLWIQINTFQPVSNAKLKVPSKIFLPHRIVPLDNVCLIVKENQQKIQDQVEKEKLDEIVTTVLSIPRIKRRYKTIKEKCELRNEHKYFFADQRVIKDATVLLGKVLEQKKLKFLPISLKKDTIRHQIAKCFHSTHFKLSEGTSHIVACGLASQPTEHVLENVLAIMDVVLKKYIAKGWYAIDNITLKTSDSIAIPIWQAETDVAKRRRNVVHIQNAAPLTKKQKLALKQGKALS
ncbi:U3 snoRNP-associated protein Cic1/Utp30 family protein [Schizosaccharomyces japonicus yFS275]|uniref:U3 snoRNP-associated protein Cic1/Utp30 family protein n=1 Tax=Schizosaccharomyces japonicus (strain yFS275 / FY16936) TaxID=402676 RepID=B6JYT3_SCHJY|nr:U3 snoRNP-associated protein Cic1/Utp30 family protein [Schizosaccharomyces japonicus yFS275]EEB06701.1 U3 snoRNP-associated protein Cic1/Utp30 family protein [Schizosaccharomyces japonicus yFS275]